MPTQGNKWYFDVYPWCRQFDVTKLQWAPKASTVTRTPPPKQQFQQQQPATTTKSSIQFTPPSMNVASYYYPSLSPSLYNLSRRSLYSPPPNTRSPEDTSPPVTEAFFHRGSKDPKIGTVCVKFYYLPDLADPPTFSSSPHDPNIRWATKRQQTIYIILIL